MAHSAEDVYLMVMTGGYKPLDIKRWAEEIAEDAVESARSDIELDSGQQGYKLGYADGCMEGTMQSRRLDL